MNKTKIGAGLWICCLQYFAAEAAAILAWRGPYSLSRNYISDLGALRSPAHAAMNASFMIQGALILSGTALVWSAFPKGKLWAAALLLIGSSGLGVTLVGLEPEDARRSLHFLGAAENLICCNAGMALMGVAMLRAKPPMRSLGSLTLALGLEGLAGVALLGMRIYLGFGVGAIERAAAYPFPLWLAGMGALLMMQRGLPAVSPPLADARAKTARIARDKTDSGA